MPPDQPSKGQAIGQIVVDAVSTALPVVGSVLKLLGLGEKGPDDKAKKKDIDAAIQKEREVRLAEAQTKLKPMLDVSVELATLNAFLKPAITAQERVKEMVGILSVNQEPSDAIWKALKNKWEQVTPILKGFSNVPEKDVNRVRDVILRVNLFDLQGINNDAAVQLGQFINDKDVLNLNDGLKDVSKSLLLLFKVITIELSNLQNEIDDVTAFVKGPPPAPADVLGESEQPAEVAAPLDAGAASALQEEREDLNEEVRALRQKFPPTVENQWCFSWFEEAESSDGLKSRGALVKSSKWTTGQDITVSFLDGDKTLQERVEREAQKWSAQSGLARLNLIFLDTNDTDIRISFKYRGSWSAIGTTCRQVTDKTKPTMNFGWLRPDSSDEAVRRVVLHEFGHALGLIHEHQNPNGHISWNRDAVIRDLSGSPNYWTLDKIQKNMFDPYEMDEVNSTPLDKDSIMMYPIPASWTTDGTSVGLNSDLSQADKDFIRDQYRP